MKKIIAFFLIELFLVQNIFALKLCFPEKYERYEDAFIRTFNKMIEKWDNKLEYKYFQTMEDYSKSLSLFKCDLALIEPALYDQFYDTIAKINGLNETGVDNILTERMNDPEDGQIYKELIKDLQVNGRNEVHAFPLFIDYGILYYRNDFFEDPPVSWNEIKSCEYLFDYLTEKSIYIGQFYDYREFFYNLFENVLNTKDEINYKVVEREVTDTLGIFKNLYDKNIIDNNYIWHLNSDNAVIRFNEKKAVFMRNWSSYLYNVTTAFKKYNKKGEFATFGITKTLYNDESTTANRSRAINKGIYICVSDSIKDEDISDAIIIAKTFSDKQFMKLLVEEEEVFYDIPAYLSLIIEDNTEVNNKAYCERINCEFFEELSKDQVIPTYSIFYRNGFIYKLMDFFEETKMFLKGEKDFNSVMMKYFKDQFKNAGESTRLSLIRINSLTFIANILLIISVCKILL